MILKKLKNCLKNTKKTNFASSGVHAHVHIENTTRRVSRRV